METKVLEIINGIRSAKGLSTLAALMPDADLRHDLELTSFDLAELTVKLEDEYDIDIFEDGLVNTVGEVLEKLSKYCYFLVTKDGNIPTVTFYRLSILHVRTSRCIVLRVFIPISSISSPLWSQGRPWCCLIPTSVRRNSMVWTNVPSILRQICRSMSLSITSAV